MSTWCWKSLAQTSATLKSCGLTSCKFTKTAVLCSFDWKKHILSSIDIIDPSNKKYVPNSNIMNSYSYTVRTIPLKMVPCKWHFLINLFQTRSNYNNIWWYNCAFDSINIMLLYCTVKQQKLHHRIYIWFPSNICTDLAQQKQQWQTRPK